MRQKYSGCCKRLTNTDFLAKEHHSMFSNEHSQLGEIDSFRFTMMSNLHSEQEIK